MVLTAQTFEEFALAHPDQQWELHGGKLREKPGGSFDHNDAMCQLGFRLMDLVDRKTFGVRVNAGYLRHDAGNYYIPDVFVFPQALAEPLRHRFDVLEVYRDALPLVVEVWSPSTGGYDIDEKLPLYFARGDLEIWRIQPDERSLIAWRRQADGSYAKTEYRGGVVPVSSLAGVVIDLDALFDW